MRLSLILFFSFFACLCSSAEIYNLKEYTQSLRTWKKLKPCSYSYVTSRSSFTLYNEVTKFRVLRNRVIRREFESWYFTRGTYVKTPLESWVESTRSQIGSHESGAPAKTIDQLYKQCREEVLIQDPAENTMYFELDSRGILKMCGFFPNNCADDCFQGITIDELTFN